VANPGIRLSFSRLCKVISLHGSGKRPCHYMPNGGQSDQDGVGIFLRIGDSIAILIPGACLLHQARTAGSVHAGEPGQVSQADVVRQRAN